MQVFWPSNGSFCHCNASGIFKRNVLWRNGTIESLEHFGAPSLNPLPNGSNSLRSACEATTMVVNTQAGVRANAIRLSWFFLNIITTCQLLIVGFVFYVEITGNTVIASSLYCTIFNAIHVVYFFIPISPVLQSLNVFDNAFCLCFDKITPQLQRMNWVIATIWHWYFKLLHLLRNT